MNSDEEEATEPGDWLFVSRVLHADFGGPVFWYAGGADPSRLPDKFSITERPGEPSMRLEFFREAGLPYPETDAFDQAFAVVQLDGWRVRIELDPGRPDMVGRIEVTPDPDEQSSASSILRRLGLGGVEDALRRWLTDPTLVPAVGRPWTNPRRRPGRAGTDPRVYAAVAARYVRALAESPRAPYRAMVEQYEAEGVYVTEAALRAKVYKARNLRDGPLLTSTDERTPGGELTKRGRRLAAEMGEEV